MTLYQLSPKLNKPTLLKGLKYLKDIYDSEYIPRQPKPWYLSLYVLIYAARELRWSVTLGTKVIRPLLEEFYSRRTMKTGLILPNGNVTYPSAGMLPSEIVVEECSYAPDDPDGITVTEVGRIYTQNLFNNSSENIPDCTQAQQSQGIKDHNSDVMMNFGEHRAATISANDPRTIKMLKPETPAFHGDKGKMMSKIVALADELPQTPSRQRNTKKVVKGSGIVGLRVEQTLIVSVNLAGLKATASTWIVKSSQRLVRYILWLI